MTALVHFIIHPVVHWVALILCASWVTSKSLKSKLSLICVLYILILFNTPMPNYLMSFWNAQIESVTPVESLDVVVLGGQTAFFNKKIDQYVIQSSFGRFNEAIRLVKKVNSSNVFFSGATLSKLTVDQLGENQTFERYAREFLSETKITSESNSKNTYENAMEVHKLFINDGRPFYLVTSEHHMPRSMYIFKKLGMKPMPVAVNETLPYRWSMVPNLNGIRVWLSFWHEFLGMIRYKLY